MSVRNDTTVKIAADVARDAKIVAAFRQQTLAEYISAVVRPIVERDLRRELVSRSAEHFQRVDPDALAAEAREDGPGQGMG